MEVTINNMALYGVRSISYNRDELFIVFGKDTYMHVEELEEVLNKVNLTIANYIFNGYDAYGYENSDENQVLIVIPEYMRDTFKLIVKE